MNNRTELGAEGCQFWEHFFMKEKEAVRDDKSFPFGLLWFEAKDPWVRMPPKNAAKNLQNGGKGPAT